MTHSNTVVLFAPNAPSDPGGVATSTERIAQQAKARGEEVHLLFWSKHAPPGAQITQESSGIYYHHVGRLPNVEQNLRALVDHGSRLLASVHASLAHGIYASSAGYAAVLAAELVGCRSIVSLRGNDLDRAQFIPEQLPFLTHAINHADYVTAVSKEMSERASRQFKRPVAHISNSIDGALFKPETPDNSLYASLNLPRGATVLGFVGELREKKGLRFLLPAFAALAEEQNAYLLLIGGLRKEAEPAFEHFKQSAPEAAARIRTLEYSNNPKRLCRLLALCDLLVFPSLFEGTPNAVLEAMAAGRPVLASAVGGHLDLISHGKTGALFDLADLDQLPLAISECLAHPERLRWGGAAREFVLREHPLSRESAGFAHLYASARAGLSRAPSLRG